MLIWKKRLALALQLTGAALVASAGLLVGSASAASPATDATGSNITTSPVSLDLHAPPGVATTTTLQMQNNGPKPIAISVELRTFTAKGTTGQALIGGNTHDPSLAWVHFSETSFEAEPGVYHSIQMTVRPPADASLGYYYAVLFQPVVAKPVVTNTNTVTLSNAILVLADTGSSNEVHSLAVTNFSTDHSLYEYLPATFNVTIKNTGNIFTPPQGVIYISKDSSFKQIISTLDVNKPGGRILPNSSRSFASTWNDGFPVFQPQTVAGQPVLKNNGQPVEQLHWDFSKTNHLRFGKYYAKLVLVYSNGQRQVPIYGLVSFWVVPWKIILLILLILAIQVALIVALVRYRRIVKQARKLSKSKSQKVDD